MQQMKSLLLALSVVAFQGCAKTEFSNATEASESLAAAASICQTALIDTTRTVKVLFLVDASGSNVSESTDPKKQWRAAAINDLVNRYGARSNFHFGLVTFQGSSAKSQIMTSAGKGIFSNQNSEIQAGIQRFMANQDAGATPYKSALSMAKSLISQDMIDHANENAVYSVVMVSDGAPTDYSTPEAVIPDVQSIVGLAADRITLNGVFYYNSASAIVSAHMQFMKNVGTYGKGSFIVANSSQSIQLDDVIKVQKEICN
jgi:uncharacterized protein YegL